MRLREPRERPEPWLERKARARARWALPFHRIDWFCEWFTWALSHWVFLEALEYLGTLSVLVAVIFYFAESGDRAKQKHYQAWQVINTAQGKGGSGGRIEALQELNQDRVPLTGVDAENAFLMGVRLDRATMMRCNLESADLRHGSFRHADLSNSDLKSANFRESDFEGANLRNSVLDDADLTGADLANADFAGTDLIRTDLRYADLKGAHLDQPGSMELANFYGVRNLSEALRTKLLAAGAVSIKSDEDWMRAEQAVPAH